MADMVEDEEDLVDFPGNKKSFNGEEELEGDDESLFLDEEGTGDSELDFGGNLGDDY